MKWFLSLKNWSLQMCLVLAIRLSSQRKELSSVALSHSTLLLLLGLLDWPRSESSTCSGCEGSCWAFGCPEGLSCSWVSHPFSESVLADPPEWSLHSLLKQESSCTVLVSWLSCVCRSPSGVLFWWSSLWVRLLGSAWLCVLSEHCLGSGLCLCGCEQWICSWELRVLSWLWGWLWWLWICQKALRSCSNSESRGRPISRCISRLPSHSSSFEKEVLKEWKTKSCTYKRLYGCVFWNKI